MMGHYFLITGALFLPIMGHYSLHTDTNDGAPSPSLEYHTEIAYHIEIKSD
ncbi:unnamed protein product, partial [Staurois parvus]